jgi:hypothetical protein
MTRLFATIVLCAIALPCMAQDRITPSAEREVILDGHIRGAQLEGDSTTLTVIPARSAITAAYGFVEGDSAFSAYSLLEVWAFSASADYHLLTWTSEGATTDECMGCAIADLPWTAGSVAYSKDAMSIVLRHQVPGTPLCGSFRLVIRYITLY